MLMSRIDGQRYCLIASTSGQVPAEDLIAGMPADFKVCKFGVSSIRGELVLSPVCFRKKNSCTRVGNSYICYT